MNFSVYKRLGFLGGVCLLAAMLLTACDNDKRDEPQASDKVPAALKQSLETGDIKIERRFETAMDGITGYVLKRGGQYQIVYGQDDYLILGQLISPEGENLSAQYEEQYVPKPNVGQVVDQLKESRHLVTLGPDEAPTLYAFVDPNCVFCHRFYNDVKPLIEAGKLQVHFVNVAILKASSAGRAAAILEADDPAEAMATNEKDFDEQNEEGGIEEAKSPAKDIQQAIDDHTELMQKAGGSGTPTLLYKRDDRWQIKVGLPGQDWLEDHAAEQ